MNITAWKKKKNFLREKQIDKYIDRQIDRQIDR